MKTLALSILITISSFSFAQSNPNQVSIHTEIEDGITILNWKSNKEVNTSYYIIERSQNGGEFELINTQKAGSSTYQSRTYSYEDVDSNANSSYRITLVLMDGTSLSTLSDQTIDQEFASIIKK